MPFRPQLPQQIYLLGHSCHRMYIFEVKVVTGCLSYWSQLLQDVHISFRPHVSQHVQYIFQVTVVLPTTPVPTTMEIIAVNMIA
jgi:hypothetical protein